MNRLKISVVLALVACGSGCGRQIVEFAGGDAGGDAGDDPGSTAPTVIAVVPMNGAIAVARDTVITATFSRAMSSATIDTVTFTVARGATPVSGAVTLDAASNTAAFIPATPLGAGEVYTATITTGAKDLAGQPLAASYGWSFTTSTGFRATVPLVIFTNPADLATNVSVSKRPTATFNKAMDPTTINLLTFTLFDAAIPVLGGVSYDARTNTAMFSPSAALALDTTYTATITTGAKDTDRLALAADHTWSFTTGACSMARVELGSAGTYGALTGSTVTNTGPTSITGDLGVSPGTAVTGFPPGVVIGHQHAGDATAGTAIFDLTTAFNDVAGRMSCALSIAEDTSGLTLTPGLYRSPSTLEISTGDLTLDAQGDSDAVFVFAIASMLTTSSNTRIILTNGARPGNVYWQVGSSATLGTNSLFQGTIMADQSITLATGAVLNGRALARIGAVSLDSNTVVTPQ